MSTLTLTARHERNLVFLLAGIQFFHIVDFMVLMPLGPQLMRLLDITPAQFGFLVAAYTFSAGISGFVFAFLVDRFDRRRAMLGIFSGFLIATLACGFAWDFHSLIIARLAAGFFGGILGANVLAYLGDCIPEIRRGTATGKVMAAFSLAAVLGVPLGLFLAEHFSWRAPFIFVAGFGFFLALAGTKLLPSIPARDTGPVEIVATLRAVFSERNHLYAFALVASIMLAGFSVIPFISPYLVGNAGLAEKHLSLTYFFGGLATLFTAPLIGRVSDRLGKVKALRVVGTLSIIPIVVLTHLPVVPLFWILVVSTLFMVLVSGRMIPVLALVTAASSPALRGRFLSMNAALQQIASSLAAFLPTLVLVEGSKGELLHYDWVGYGAIAMTLLALWLAGKVEVRS